MQRLMEIVNSRNAIVEVLDEDRQRYKKYPEFSFTYTFRTIINVIQT